MTDEQLAALEQLAKYLNYGGGPDHSKQVQKLAAKIYRELVKAGLLVASENDLKILSASALLHDIGLPEKKHNQAAFDILKVEIPRTLIAIPLSSGDLSAVLYCVLWHRSNNFKKRDDVRIFKRLHVRRLAAIIRVGDALDRSLQQIVGDVSLNFDGHSLEFVLKSQYSLDIEKERAGEKANLLKEAFKLDSVSFVS
jgi:exopolyphosphatase/guanosine-5'-triphosphate,3'-diphosphate pyrophosphatase